ncbi:hypothetical protein EDC01DRAFT_659401 [Geopyxis carbonaria]|nr:hypothetical protein EDC01DRAFT_659401 [Geopyxis carbonaria]
MRFQQAFVAVAFALLASTTTMAQAQTPVLTEEVFTTVAGATPTTLVRVAATITAPGQPAQIITTTRVAAAPTTPPAAPTPTPKPTPAASSNPPSKTVLIAASTGGAVVVAAIILGIWFCCRRRRRRRSPRNSIPVDFTPQPHHRRVEPTIPVLPPTPPPTHVRHSVPPHEYGYENDPEKFRDSRVVSPEPPPGVAELPSRRTSGRVPQHPGVLRPGVNELEGENCFPEAPGRGLTRLAGPPRVPRYEMP